MAWRLLGGAAHEFFGSFAGFQRAGRAGGFEQQHFFKVLQVNQRFCPLMAMNWVNRRSHAQYARHRYALGILLPSQAGGDDFAGLDLGIALHKVDFKLLARAHAHEDAGARLSLGENGHAAAGISEQQHNGTVGAGLENTANQPKVGNQRCPGVRPCCTPG